jgi:hypothetical protein
LNKNFDNISEDSYECENCGTKAKISNGKTPEFCGKTMSKLTLDVCLQTAHTENARSMDPDEPCDDSRAG